MYMITIADNKMVVNIAKTCLTAHLIIRFADRCNACEIIQDFNEE